MILTRFAVCVAAVAPMVSCDIEYEPEVCDHNVEIVYWYDAEMSAADNRLSDVVSTLDEYIFDGDGVLYDWRSVPVDECTGGFPSTTTLPPGRYSVVTWGNRTDINTPNEVRKGVTRREQMLLSPDCCYSGPHTDAAAGCNTLQDNGDRLYYAYRTFTVPEVGKASVRAQLVHSHLVLRYRIRWRGTAPANTGDFHTDLDSISSRYAFMPQFKYRYGACRDFDPADDDYRRKCTEHRHFIKTVFDNRAYRHRIDVDMNGDKQIYGEFVSYRLRNTTPVTMSLWSAGRTTRAGEPVQLMKDVDLGGWFYRKGIELDRNLKQDFYLDFEILDDGRVIVSEMEIADWTDGGYL